MTNEGEASDRRGYKTLDYVDDKYYVERIEGYGPDGENGIRIIAVGNKGLDALCEKYDGERYAYPYFQAWRKSILDKLGAAKWTSWHYVTMLEEQFLKISSEE